MRTKALIMAAAALAAGIATSNAQVYSQNVVGYVTLNLTNGENLIANQMDADGTGTNNNLQSVFGSVLPNQTKVYAFVGGQWESASYNAGTGKWLGSAAITNAVNANLNPGYGVLVDITTATPTNVPLTLVGNVLSGPFTNQVPAGVDVVSSLLPESGLIDTNLGYVPTKGDKVYTWNPGTQNYNGTTPSWTGTKWLGGDPTLTAGEAIVLSAASNNVWGVNFTNN